MSDNFDDRDEFYNAIKPISYSLLIFGGIYFIVSTLATYLIFYFSRVHGILWRKAYFQSLLEKDAGFFDLNPEATSGNNISEECRYIEEAFGDDLMLFISSISLFLALWIASLFYSLELTLFSLIIFPAQYVGVMLMNVRSPSSHQTRMKMYSSAQLLSEETLENSKTVASLNCQEPRIKEYSESLKPLEASRIREGINEGIGWGTMFSVLFAATGVMFYVATVYISEEKDTWAQGEMDMLDMMVVYYCFFNGSTLIGISSNSLNKILRGIASANRIKEIIGEKGAENGGIKIEDDSWGIQIEKAEFSYPSKPEVQVLRSISFNIAPGEKIGLVGATGCGKSTIAQLLLGFYKCSSGFIKFNDVYIEDLDIKFLRNYISYVNQEPLLYSTTINKNIRLGKPNCSEEEIIEAAKCAEAYDFIQNMPKKLNSYVGNRGSQLSGGEKLRIALARAFLREPKLLILDEATSALDAITETKVLQNISARYPRTSMLVIAQRLRTIRDLDTVHLIENGKILGSGSFEELVQMKGRFNQLLEATTQTSILNTSSESTPLSENIPLGQDEILSESPNQKENELEGVKVPLVPTFYPYLIVAILFSSMISGSAFTVYGYLYALIIINLFEMETSVNEDNFIIMWYIVADAFCSLFS